MPRLTPLPRDAFDFAAARHLLVRAGFGGTPGMVQGLLSKGLDEAVDWLVDFEGESATGPDRIVQADTFDPRIKMQLTAADYEAYRKAREAGDEEAIAAFRRKQEQQERDDRSAMRSFEQWWLSRMIETPRPLEEKLTLFWHGHFAASYTTVENSWHMFRQNQFFRKHAAGNFGDLLHGIIEDPAMLRFLDNNRNRKGSPNENLAREIMELFSLGEPELLGRKRSPYRESDIKEGARALTGYTYRGNEFFFDESQHDNGLKRILGRSGRWNGHELVDMLLAHPSCSEFIAWKIYRAFVNDVPETPPRDDVRKVVVQLGKTLKSNKYNLKKTLGELFRSGHFYAAANRAAHIKSPIELVVGTIRDLGVPVRNVDTLRTAAARLGQRLGHPPSVKGWDGGRVWINTSTMFLRQNTAVWMLTGRDAGGHPWPNDTTPFDPMPLVEQLERQGEINPDEATVYLQRLLLACPVDDARSQAIRHVFTLANDRVNADSLTAALCVLTALPEYQLS